MDDCNVTRTAIRSAPIPVQIPLWTIVTKMKGGSIEDLACSDSSMDDCNSSGPAGTEAY